MSIANWSIRSLSSLVSFLIVVMFLSAYFLFKYLWSYDKALQQVEQIHAREVQQVKTMLSLGQSDLEGKLADHAAWDATAEFVLGNNDSFITIDMNEHTMESLGIAGVFIANPARKIILNRRYDLSSGSLVEASEGWQSYILSLIEMASEQNSESVSPVTGVMAYGRKAFLYSAARICNSQAEDCTKGFIGFIQPLQPNYLQLVEMTTGLDVNISILESVPIIYHSHAESTSSFIGLPDQLSGSYIQIEVNHSVARPKFIGSNELSVVVGFSFTLFIMNLLLVHKLIQPMNQARKALIEFSEHGKGLPDESYFVSKEMKQFTRAINR